MRPSAFAGKTPKGGIRTRGDLMTVSGGFKTVLTRWEKELFPEVLCLHVRACPTTGSERGKRDLTLILRAYMTMPGLHAVRRCDVDLPSECSVLGSVGVADRHAVLHEDLHVGSGAYALDEGGPHLPEEVGRAYFLESCVKRVVICELGGCGGGKNVVQPSH